MSTTGKAESYIELKGSLSLPDSIKGKSAYEIAVMHDFDGTEEEWLLHLERAQAEEVEEAAEQAKTDISEAKKTMLSEIEIAAEIVQTEGDSETAVMSQKAVTKELEELRANSLERDIEAFVPVNIMDGVTTTAGSMWAGLDKLSTSSSTSSYTAINEIINVAPNDELLFRDGQYVIYCFDENGASIGGQMVIKSYVGGTSDGKFIAPENCRQLRVSYRHDTVTVVGLAILRLTPTPEELGALPLCNDDFTIKADNIKDSIVVALLAPLKGKMVVNFGDSIFGNFRDEDSISSVIAKHTGATVYNCGFGGCRMSRHNLANYDAFSMYNLANAIANNDFSLQDGAFNISNENALPSYFTKTLAVLKSIDFSKVDIITIAYGTNDFMSSNAIENASNLYDTTTFAGALRHSIETILTAYPHIRIFVCSQIYRFWMDSNGAFTDDSDTHGVNNKLTDFVAKTEEISAAYHLPYIDNYYELGLNKFNRSIYFTGTDSTHPNATGRELLARHIAKKLY